MFKNCHQNHNFPFLCHDRHSDLKTSAASVLRARLCKLWFRCQVNNMGKAHCFIGQAYHSTFLETSLRPCMCRVEPSSQHAWCILAIFVGWSCGYCKKQAWWVTKTWSFSKFLWYKRVWRDVLCLAKSHVLFKIEKEILRRLYSWNFQICYPKKRSIFSLPHVKTRKNSKWHSFFQSCNIKITMNIQKIQRIFG